MTFEMSFLKTTKVTKTTIRINKTICSFRMLSLQLSDAGFLAAIPLSDFAWLIELMLHLLVLTWEPCRDILVLSVCVGSPSQDTWSNRQRSLAWYCVYSCNCWCVGFVLTPRPHGYRVIMLATGLISSHPPNTNTQTQTMLRPNSIVSFTAHSSEVP